MKQAKFYTQATAQITESAKKGGYFHYSSEQYTGCIIKVEGTTATITEANGRAFTKRTTGKHFSFVGREVKAATYEKRLRAIQAAQAAKKARHAQDMENRKQAAETALNAVVMYLNDTLTIDRVQKWMVNNSGSSNTRKNRWANRAQKLHLPRTYGNTVRDFCAGMN